MQAENLASNSHKKFYVLFMLLFWFAERKFFSATYFLDETFYHTSIPIFSITISAATVIKATKYSTY